MKLFLILTILFLVLSPAFADISSGLQPGECWELLPGHVACCGDNKCTTSALETCGVCAQDCFCAPNFECNIFAADEYGNKIADERGCAPEGYDAQPSDSSTSGESSDDGGSSPCGSAAILIAPFILLSIYRR